MRKLILLITMGLLLTATADARRPKDRAGSIKNNVFTDKKYKFELTLPDDWKSKVGENEDNYRLILTQTTFEIPPHYANAKDYTKIPRTVVYVDTTSMGVAEFIDSLLSDSYNSGQKKEVYKEFEILNKHSGGSGLTRQDLIPRERKPLDLAGERGFLWAGKVKYHNEISLTATSAGGQRVYGGFFGIIVGVKKDKNIILLHTICEENYAEAILAQSMTLANSLKWTE